MNYKTCLFFIIPLLYTVALKAQTVSNEGTEFWAVFPTHVPDAQLANISLYITGSQASSGMVKVGNFSEKFIVNPNWVTEVKIPRADAYIDFIDNGKVLPNQAIHVLVDSGKPKVVLYAHIFASRRSAASLILPEQGLGNQYYSFNYPQYEKLEGKNYITLIATNPNTKIRLKKENTLLAEVTLNNVNDVYEYLSDDDLTGVSIASDDYKNFAVFSGNTAVRIASEYCVAGKNISLDPLYQQCYPVESWGLNYGVIPFSNNSPTDNSPVRTAGQNFRIIAKNNGTTLKINGNVVANLNKGEFYSTSKALAAAAYLSANEPIAVAQYTLSQACSNVNYDPKSYSDPDMVILNPIEYNTKNITLYSTSKEHITEQYINVLIKTTGVTSFKINGQAPTAPFIVFTNMPGYSYLQLNLNGYNTQVFNLKADEGFNAVAYGFGDVESYAYSAGTNLASNQFVSGVKQSNNQLIDSACVNDDYYFKLTLPFLSAQIVWQMDAAETPIVQNNPTPKIITNNNVTIYEYILPKTAAYQIVGNHAVKIEAKSIVNAAITTIDYDFKVLPLPVVAFTAKVDDCLNSFKFTDDNPNQPNITSRLWNFGDSLDNPNNYTSTAKEIVHSYKKSGNYKIRLTLGSALGCLSYLEKNIVVQDSPKPVFSISLPNCVSNPVTFTDNTPINSNFEVKKWFWEFGDGDSVYALNKNPVPHIYKTAGNFKISLTLLNDKDCPSNKKDSILKINALPIVDFMADKVCLNDAFTSFVNQSILPITGTTDSLAYVWDFGDPNAGSQNPNTSTEKNPKHKYIKDGDYVVKLSTSILPNACKNSISKTISVNSNVLKADFELPNNGKLCNGKILSLKNLSTLTGFGAIVKIDIYFDFANQPTVKETFNNITPDKLYTHIYPGLVPENSSKNYLIKLVAYSGNICFAETTKTISVIPNPKLQFNPVLPVCTPSASLQLMANEINGIAGEGVYSGLGVLPNGIFNPTTAGIGTHQIKYKFTSAAGCSDSLTQEITVVDTPIIDTLADTEIPEGETITLKPTVKGNNLSFQWQPTTGMLGDNTLNPTIKGINDIVYTLTTSNGICESTQKFKIIVLRKLEIYNTFTPNNDGVNDVWNIKNVNQYPNINVQIFNRYGIKLFQSNGYASPWDGTYNNQPVPAGTYYYVINLGDNKNKLSGFITLVR